MPGAKITFIIISFMEFDLLIIGSGLAGLYTALQFGARGRVALITKGAAEDGSTTYAQGGIAAAVSPDDDVDLHAADTIRTGAGLCDEKVVRFVVREGPARVEELARLGVAFSKKADGGFDLGMEGGHSRRRILHAADLTGKAIEDALVDAARRQPNIDIFENFFAIDLVRDERTGRCAGAYVLDRATGKVITFQARATVLATGGAGKVYLITSNPDVATGDGVAMAWRAGAAIANMEFFQFHPTCLFLPGARTFQERSFLLSEALRGEGAVLLNAAGERFMPAYDEAAELAPRDIVARAIDAEMKKTGTDHVYLDATPIGKDKLRKRFPYIYDRCLELGVDLAKEPAPVAPAAHYCCGGILTDEHGRATIPGLYAVGEVACTGLHGANRLASNSLLEAAVFAKRAADAAAAEIASAPKTKALPDFKAVEAKHEPVAVSHDWYLVRRTMRDFVGIVRTDQRLEMAASRVTNIKKNINALVERAAPAVELLELRNIATVAALIVASARSRVESRGLHYNADHPERDDARFEKPTVLVKDRSNIDC